MVAQWPECFRFFSQAAVTRAARLGEDTTPSDRRGGGRGSGGCCGGDSGTAGARCSRGDQAPTTSRKAGLGSPERPHAAVGKTKAGGVDGGGAGDMVAGGGIWLLGGNCRQPTAGCLKQTLSRHQSLLAAVQGDVAHSRGVRRTRKSQSTHDGAGGASTRRAMPTAAACRCHGVEARAGIESEEKYVKRVRRWC